MITSINKIATIQRRYTSVRKRLFIAEKVASDPTFEKLLQYVNAATYKFILCQVRTQNQTPRSRRFTLDEKILCLTFLKASGRGYKILSKIFALPSKRTLTNLLNKVPLYPGINKELFEVFKSSVEKMKLQEKCCVILFDEMSLDCDLQYNVKEDFIIGVEDFGTDRMPALADHVLVFMAKGIYKKWKQPVCFTFSNGPIKSLQLKQLLKNVIIECQNIGLVVVGTICDQGSSNQSVINSFLKDSAELCQQQQNPNRLFGFLVNNQEVVPLYDVPHLFKGIRNNMLTKNLHFEENGIKKVAEWDHVEQFYNLDASEENRICPKLTEQHALRSRINKMKVSCCSQIFSHQVGSLMSRIAKWGKRNNYLLPVKCKNINLLFNFC